MTDTTPSQARLRIEKRLEELEGRPVTENDDEWIGWLVSDYHDAWIDAHPNLGDESWFRPVDRTDVVEEALRTLAVRSEPVSHRQVLVMQRILRGLQPPENAQIQLPTRTIDELEETSVLANNPELQAALRKSLAGPVLAFQEPVDDETVYCEPCDREFGWTSSQLWLHNHRHHEEALADA